MNTISTHIARHLREFYSGKNWTASGLAKALEGVTWQQATTKVESFNTIATLVYHIHYYVEAAIDVLEGRTLNRKDELSFNHPPINSQADWEAITQRVFSEGEHLAGLIEPLSDKQYSEFFEQEKYGTYYRNLQGIVEHHHYHLGQIVFLKKWIH